MDDDKVQDSADDGFVERVRSSFARQGIMAHLGATLGDVERGKVEIRLPFRSEISQQHGFFHAGALTTIADSAGGYAGYTHMGRDDSVLSIEFKMNFLAPAAGQMAVAVGRVLRSGRTITVTEMDVYVDDAGNRKHVAHGSQTLIRAARSVGSGGPG